MLNSKETLKKLHQALPNLTLDELFTILDCYTEEYTYALRDWEPKLWYSTTTTNGVEETPSIITCVKGDYTAKYESVRH